VCGGEGVRTDQRWDAGVGAGGVKPGSTARVWRSLDVDEPADVQPAEREHHDIISEENCRDERRGEDKRRGDPQNQPPPENLARRV
jgi:hypothetical protein